MVSTHLKNISQIGNLPQIGVKIKNVWNHHLVYNGRLGWWIFMLDTTYGSSSRWKNHLGPFLELIRHGTHFLDSHRTSPVYLPIDEWLMFYGKIVGKYNILGIVWVWDMDFFLFLWYHGSRYLYKFFDAPKIERCLWPCQILKTCCWLRFYAVYVF